MAAVRWGNDLLFRLCAHLPPLLFHAVVWGGMALAVLDQISAMVVVSRYANRHPRLEQLNRELGRGSERLRQKITASVEKRIQRAYPAAARLEPTTSAEKQLSLPTCSGSLSSGPSSEMWWRPSSAASPPGSG